jgi:hypothetical protein
MFSVSENQQTHPPQTIASTFGIPPGIQNAASTSSINLLQSLLQQPTAFSANLLQNLVANLPLSQSSIGSAVRLEPSDLINASGFHALSVHPSSTSNNLEPTSYGSSSTPDSEQANNPNGVGALSPMNSTPTAMDVNSPGEEQSLPKSKISSTGMSEGDEDQQDQGRNVWWVVFFVFLICIFSVKCLRLHKKIELCTAELFCSAPNILSFFPLLRFLLFFIYTFDILVQ